MVKKVDVAAQQPNEPQEITDKRTKAVDLLYEGMLFWHDEGQKIVNRLKNLLEAQGNSKEGLALAKIWKDYDSRWIEIASRLAPYQSAKLSSVELKGGTVTKYIVEVPRRSATAKEWMEQADIDLKQIPHLSSKPIVDIIRDPEDADDIEYEEINGHSVN